MMEYGEVETYVIFTDSNFKPLQCLKRGFQHVFIWQWNGYIWVHYNNNLITHEAKTVGKWKGEPIPLNTDIIKLYLTEQDATVLRLPPMEDLIVHYAKHPTLFNSIKRALAPNTCVTSVKNFLGLNSLWIQTPYQLYKELKQWV